MRAQVTQVTKDYAKWQESAKIAHVKISDETHKFMTKTSVHASAFSELKSRIEQAQAKVAVIGLGYVGLPLALLYTEQRFSVTGFDIDTHKVSALMQGSSYIFRIPATEIQEA